VPPAAPTKGGQPCTRACDHSCPQARAGRISRQQVRTEGRAEQEGFESVVPPQPEMRSPCATAPCPSSAPASAAQHRMRGRVRARRKHRYRGVRRHMPKTQFCYCRIQSRYVAEWILRRHSNRAWMRDWKLMFSQWSTAMQMTGLAIQSTMFKAARSPVTYRLFFVGYDGLSRLGCEAAPNG